MINAIYTRLAKSPLALDRTARMEGAAVLSERNQAGLRLLSTAVDDAAFQELLVLAFAILTRQPGASEEILKTSPKFGSCDAVALKQAYAGLIALILEAAKGNASAEELAPVLEELAIAGQRAALVGRLYAAQKARVRDVLGCTGFDFPNLVDVEWRLDHQVISSASGKLSQPLYLVKLITKDATGALSESEFGANRQQLADMLARVKDATKQVDRLVGALNAAAKQ